MLHPHRALSLHEPYYLSSLFSLRSNSRFLHSFSFSPLLLPYFNKKYMVFVHFHMLHLISGITVLISGITVLIMFVQHQPICLLRKTWKPIFRACVKIKNCIRCAKIENSIRCAEIVKKPNRRYFYKTKSFDFRFWFCLNWNFRKQLIKILL